MAHDSSCTTASLGTIFGVVPVLLVVIQKRRDHHRHSQLWLWHMLHQNLWALDVLLMAYLNEYMVIISMDVCLCVCMCAREKEIEQNPYQ